MRPFPGVSGGLRHWAFAGLGFGLHVCTDHPKWLSHHAWWSGSDLEHINFN
jgi:hypothetical protein